MADWIGPWLLAGLAIWPLFLVERWMHKHIQGVSYLLTNNPQGAVLVYYLLLLPGVALHEGSQWVMAKLLRVKIKKFQLWPEKQRSGEIKLGLVDIDKDVDTIRATVIGIIPLISGLTLLTLIGTTRFDTTVLVNAFSSGDVPTISAGIKQFTSTPDFWLWIYLVFSIANAMLPEEHDRITWWIIPIPLIVLFIFLAVLDLGVLIQAALDDPIAQLGRWISLALIMSLVLDLIVMGIITAMEAIFTRVLNRDLEYN